MISASNEIWHQQLFQPFHDREERLKRIIRYGNYPEKGYPTTLASHQWQVAALVREVEDVMRSQAPHFDIAKAVALAFIHDDHEPFGVGDVQSANEFHMTAEQKALYEEAEKKSIQAAIEYYPERFGDYSYGELLWEAAFYVSTLEGQVMKLCDKYVGCGEAMHEIISGNTDFRNRKVDPTYGKENPTPIEYYTKWFSGVLGKLPLLPGFVSWETAEDLPGHDFLARLYGPFPENGLPMWQYEFWKRAIMNHAPEWEQRRLGLIK